VLTRGKITNIIAAEADLVRTLGWRTRAPTVAHAVHDAIAFHEVDEGVAAEALAFSRVARTSYELVGVAPIFIAAACVVAASSEPRKVAEKASELNTPWRGSPSRYQGCAALLRAARTKQDPAKGLRYRVPRSPLESDLMLSCEVAEDAHVTPAPPESSETAATPGGAKPVTVMRSMRKTFAKWTGLSGYFSGKKPVVPDRSSTGPTL